MDLVVNFFVYGLGSIRILDVRGGTNINEVYQTPCFILSTRSTCSIPIINWKLCSKWVNLDAIETFWNFYGQFNRIGMNDMVPIWFAKVLRINWINWINRIFQLNLIEFLSLEKWRDDEKVWKKIYNYFKQTH